VEHNLVRASQLLKESGYDGTPVVVLQITDRPFLNSAAVVTRQRLEAVGFKVILKAMDWSTNLIVRARKAPPDQGRWSLLYTWWWRRRRRPFGPLRPLRRRPKRVVRLAECSATREAWYFQSGGRTGPLGAKLVPGHFAI